MKFSIIAAADKNMGIGKNNDLPWRLKGDLQYFSFVTTEAAEGKANAVIMGRNTWYSLPEKVRPLKDRLNIVLSREYEEVPKGVMVSDSFEDSLITLWNDEAIDEIFIIGGASVYAQAIKHPDCSRIYLTEVDGAFDCDVFFPEIDPKVFKLVEATEYHEEKGIRYRFVIYERV